MTMPDGKPKLRAEMHEDGSATIHIHPDYHGQCGRCMKNDATHPVWLAFDKDDITPIAGMPTPEGVWVYVCDECARPDDVTEKSGETNSP